MQFPPNVSESSLFDSLSMQESVLARTPPPYDPHSGEFHAHTDDMKDESDDASFSAPEPTGTPENRKNCPGSIP